MNKSFELVCNFPFLWDPVCKKGQCNWLRLMHFSFLQEKNRPYWAVTAIKSVAGWECEKVAAMRYEKVQTTI
jgi:hypothetical protein